MTVSRVSPPAQSIGLLRLQRGGSNADSFDIRSSESSTRSRIPSLAIASAVTTPHPPTVVRTATRFPFGSGWVANVAAVSNAPSTDETLMAPAARVAPRNTRSLLAIAPVWLCAALEPAAVAPPFKTTRGLTAVMSFMACNNDLPSPTFSMYVRATVVSSSVA